jgi:hypothetical protein
MGVRTPESEFKMGDGVGDGGLFIAAGLSGRVSGGRGFLAQGFLSQPPIRAAITTTKGAMRRRGFMGPTVGVGRRGTILRSRFLFSRILMR